MKNLLPREWDYSLQAGYYKYRPNYSEKAIDLLVAYVSEGNKPTVIDIGAGTGNLTTQLLTRGLKVTAIEPNDAMRGIGISSAKKFANVKWLKEDGINTKLRASLANWVTFGSSFNVLNRRLALKEASRLLKKRGFITCMWNHRDLSDPIQQKAENIIVKSMPGYERGVRRQDQREIIEESGLFRDIFYLEIDFQVDRTIDEYIKAWFSVSNKYWDLSTKKGQTLFNKITNNFKKELPAKFKIKYTTRAWTAQKG